MKDFFKKSLAFILSIFLFSQSLFAFADNNKVNVNVLTKVKLFSNAFFYESSRINSFLDLLIYLAPIAINQEKEEEMIIKENILDKYVSDENITLEVWTYKDDENVFAWPIEVFMRNYPNIKINLKTINSEDRMWEELLAARSVGDMPDIFMIKDTWIESYWRLISPSPQELFDVESVKNNYYPLVCKAFCTETKVWAIPLFIDSFFVFYNEELLRDDRITIGDKPASNWKGFMENSQSFKEFSDEKKDFFTLDYKNDIKSAYNLFKILATQLDIQTDNLLDNKDLSEILKFLISFTNKKTDKKTDFEKFTEGNVSLIFGNKETKSNVNKFFLDYLRKKEVNELKEVNFGYQTVPQFIDKNKHSTLGESWGFVVYSKSDDVNTAWSFISFLTNEENMKSFILKTGKTPAIKGYSADDFAKNAEIATSAGKWDSIEFKKVFEENFEKLAKGGITEKEVIENFDNFFNKK